MNVERPQRIGQRQYLFFALAALGVLMAAIDSTIVAVGLPDLERGFNAPLHWVGWTLTAYSLVQIIMLPIAGKPLLEHVLDAVTAASDVVVVGPRRDGIRDVRWTCEQPPGGGPVAALTAGLAAFTDAESADVAVLAARMRHHPGAEPAGTVEN